MRKIKKIFAGLAAAAITAVPVCAGTTASAATMGDVIGAAYAAGWPDWLVQQAISTYGGGDYTPEQYDKALGMIFQYDDAAAKRIEEMYGVSSPSSSTTTAAPEKTEGTTTTTTTQRPSDKEFIKLPLDQKQEYINSMSQKEKEEFVGSMTSEERNSILKQLGASDKAELLASFVDVGKEFGISFNIDKLSGDDLVVSAYDENGKLVNVTSMTMTVDPTGHSYTMPIVLSGAMVLAAAGGIVLVTRKKKDIKE